MTVEDTKNIGLRGVTVADTRVSDVDGDKGRLVYRGFRIEELAKTATYEEIVYLLLVGKPPDQQKLEETARAMAEARRLPAEVLGYLRSRLSTARPMDVLQGGIAVLADHDPDATSEDRDGVLRASLRLIARTASLAAAWQQLRKGVEPAPANTQTSFAAAFLEGLWQRVPTEDETRLMDLLLVLHAEHSLNASTFAAREVASTQAHLYAAVSAAVGALSGALHGGANARVMEMFLQIGALENVEPWVQSRIQAGQRVMGFGHAVYKTVDPRAGILRTVAEKVLGGKPEEKWFKMALEVERITTQKLKDLKKLELYPNVDFFSSPVLYAIGLPIDMFPVFFAVSRTAGWCAHVIEEKFAEAQPKPALYRPDAYYVGRYCGEQGCRWVPVEQRGAGCPCGKDFDGCTEVACANE